MLQIIGSALVLIALVGLPVTAHTGRSTSPSRAAQADAAFTDTATALRRPSAAASAVRTVAVGVSMLPDMDLATYLTYKSQVGVAPAAWSLWSNWGEPNATGKFPTGPIMNQLKADHTVPVIIWQPVGADHSDGTYSRYNLIAGYNDGTTYHPPLHDAYIKQFARAAKAYGDTVIIRWAHEMDGFWFPWGMGRFDNTPSNFVAAWRHVWKLFHKVGATNVRFLWSPLAPNVNKRDLYPGDKYVDYVGFTSFNWGVGTRKWTTMLAGVKTRYVKASKITRKPIIVAELGTGPGDGALGHDMSQWITEGFDAVYARLPNVKGILYFNVDMSHAGQPDWRVTPPTSPGFAAYQAVVNEAKFRGTLR
jgi:hypothetical protein